MFIGSRAVQSPAGSWRQFRLVLLISSHGRCVLTSCRCQATLLGLIMARQLPSTLNGWHFLLGGFLAPV